MAKMFSTAAPVPKNPLVYQPPTPPKKDEAKSENAMNLLHAVTGVTAFK